MSRRPSICTGINLPIQSGSDRILGLMNRGYTVEKYASIIEMIRDHLPEPSVTSDLIVGFPGETDDDFRESVRVVEKFRFDLVHTAAYSPRDGTPAARMDGQVPFAVKKRRLAEINRIQEDITMAINDALVGREFEVLVDGFAPRGDSMLQGRTSADKVVIFPGDASLLGSFRMVRITGSGNWSLRGEIIPEGTQ
jgi:tRNA-2-methylthio-N6-dimethylallyladenosine synthase